MNIEQARGGPDGREVPFAENASAQRAMFQQMRELAIEQRLDKITAAAWNLEQ